MITRNLRWFQAGIFQIVGIVGAKALRQGSEDVLAERCICLALEGIRKEQGPEELKREAAVARLPRAWAPDWFQTAFWPDLSRESYALTDLRKIPLEA